MTAVVDASKFSRFGDVKYHIAVMATFYCFLLSGKDDQPEWFVDTPTSQLETIELHGFGEEEEAERQEVNSDLRKEKSESLH